MGTKKVGAFPSRHRKAVFIIPLFPRFGMTGPVDIFLGLTYSKIGMLKGSSITAIDKFGRLIIPSVFRKTIELRYGNEVFLTSFDGQSIEIFPLEEWQDLSEGPKEKLKEPAIRRFLLRANRNGMKTAIDRRGRISLPKWLRVKTGLEGKVAIEGMGDGLILKKRGWRFD
ncbi:MAG: division/cell wall cluster transcriptional repressor MraZ [Candidatus Aminicenantales bacterium]